MTVQWIYDWLDAQAPFETQEGFDNAGLLTGRPDMEVTGILLALDCTLQTVEEAAEKGCNVILTHHPLMFAPRQNMREDTFEGAILCGLIRNHIALISAHTNLDKAEGGVNDALIARLGLVKTAGESFVRVGHLPAPMNSCELAAYCSEKLNTVVRLCGNADQPVEYLGVGSGAGSDEWQLARNLGAQAYLTGECKHHHAIEAAQAGFPILEAGHYATEDPGMDALATALQKALDEVQYKITVYRTRTSPYGECVKRP